MRVRAIKKCFIDNAIREEGDVFEYNGPRNTNVVSVDGGAQEPEPFAAAPDRKKPGRPRKVVESDSV
jgi:hypothetical protein